MRKILTAFIFSLALGFSAMVSAAPVDINTADAIVLAESIKGVGEKRAAAIVEYRKQNGPFKSVDDLTKVPGIGAKVLEDNRQNMVVSK
ncbi:MAG: helix-hairpin-helix domain-containing protein [Thiohalomonadaceae bacterium]